MYKGEYGGGGGGRFVSGEEKGEGGRFVSGEEKGGGERWFSEKVSFRHGLKQLRAGEGQRRGITGRLLERVGVTLG